MRIAADAERALEACRADYALFARHFLGIEVWDASGIDSQRSVLRAASSARTLAVRSGHKVGKTTLAAIIALAEFVLWPGSRTILTAPTGRQVREMSWREIHRLHRGAPIPIGGVLNKSMETGLVHAENATQVIGMSTDDPDRFSGFSAARLTYIVDEAPGVDEAVFEAIEGNRAGGARLIMLGNPTSNVGTFHNYFTKFAELCERYHIPSDEVAKRVESGELEAFRGKGLATQAWVDDFATKWGVQSQQYAVRVRGDFAATTSDGAIAPGVVDASMGRWSEQVPARLARERLVCALDVARFGDDQSVLYHRRGHYVARPAYWRNTDSKALAANVAAEITKLLTPGEGTYAGSPKPLLFLDAGGVGSGVLDELRANYATRRGNWPGLEIHGLDFASRSTDPKQYANTRAEIWMEAGPRIDAADLPPLDDLREDLCAPRYRYNARGQIVIESKDEVKKRIGRSPDDGDACVMLWAPSTRYAAAAVHLDWL